MKRIAFAFVLIMALFAVSAYAEEWAGTISDAHCGKAHASGDAKAQACVEKCVKGGAAAVFVTGDHVYKIADASKSKVSSHLGHKVKVTGKLEGDTVTIDKVEMNH
jgi:hypothetical protein